MTRNSLFTLDLDAMTVERSNGHVPLSHRHADARQRAVLGESNIAACGRVVRHTEAVAFATTAEQDRCRHCVALAAK